MRLSDKTKKEIAKAEKIARKEVTKKKKRKKIVSELAEPKQAVGGWIEDASQGWIWEDAKGFYWITVRNNNNEVVSICINKEQLEKHRERPLKPILKAPRQEIMETEKVSLSTPKKTKSTKSLKIKRKKLSTTKKKKK